MILKAASTFSAVNANRQSPLFSSPFSSIGSALKSFEMRNANGFVVMATKGSNNTPLTGVLFEPFEEVKKELSLVPSAPQQSLARQKFADRCKVALNEQINVAQSVSYVFHALYAYFGRDNVALEGVSEFFSDLSYDERYRAEQLMDYQNERGGRVKLHSIVMPLSEFHHEEKGDALYAMELALSLEKLVNEKLLNLHAVAREHKDSQLADFVESEFLSKQVNLIKKISEYVAQLRMVGKGHGLWEIDHMLGEEWWNQILEHDLF